ncbi:uncharacterized protein LOC122134965 [Cyprinus carpio]|uniref:Uncharacterized protein LOC122134965 n=1 Tax=Cyprinus carpio TaxID=7962 RepID=A0A9Q9ZNR3_CYPCA|nr:uncharacterized protein LOC122134965 [Cyprinus carpio]
MYPLNNTVHVKFVTEDHRGAGNLTTVTNSCIAGFSLRALRANETDKMEMLRPPPPLSLTGNLAENWPSDIALLGRQACVQLDLIRKVDALAPSSPTTKTELLSRYASVFQGLGQFPGLHHIHTDPSIPPVIHGCRKIPYAVHDRLKETLDDLEKRGVISKVSKPTAWVSSLCITEKKNGALRVCLDPRDLNKAILRQHYNIPNLEDIRSKASRQNVVHHPG